jgi:GNAT superfamily N-acetyltransferase
VIDVAVAIEVLTADSPLLETVHAWHWRHFSDGVANDERTAWLDRLRHRCSADAVPFTLLARVEGRPVGCVTVCDDDTDPRHPDEGPWLSGMVVVGRARNLGVGRALLAAAADRARELGATELWLYTSEAARFYERCGYRLVEEKRGVDDDAVLSIRL